MTKHTPEPWKLLEDMPTWPQASTLAEPRHAVMNLDDYRRAVACVNALAGLNPEAVPDVVAALRDMLDGYERLLAQSVLDVNPGANRYSIAAHTALAKLEQV
jgi:hypothetical protein